MTYLCQNDLFAEKDSAVFFHLQKILKRVYSISVRMMPGI